MVDIARVNRQAQDYLLRDFGGQGQAVRPVRGSGIGQVLNPGDFQTSYLPQHKQGQYGTGIGAAGMPTVSQFAGFPEGQLNKLRKAAGLPEQEDPQMRLFSPLSPVDPTQPQSTDVPGVQDLSSIMQGIASRQAKVSGALRAGQIAEESDLSAFGGIGGDVTGLEPFGGAGADIQQTIEQLSEKPEQAQQPADDLDAFGGAGPDIQTESQAETTADPLDAFGGAGPDVKQDEETQLSPMEALLQKTMEEFNQAAGKDTTGKDLDFYKNQFAEATGVSIDGEPDKSHALMALGLALMQNKAGKGFNVSRALGALGEAGQAALPAFEKAKEQARAGKLAAGQFALNQVAKDKAAAAASKQAELDYIRELQKGVADSQEKYRLEQLKAFEERNLERLKTQLSIYEEGLKPEEGREYDKSYDLTFAAGQGPASSWQIKMAYDKTTPDQAVLINADPMMRKYIDGRAGVNDALDLIGTMRDASRAIAEGGGTAKFAFDRVNSVAKALFPDLNTGKPTSEEEYTQALNMIMGRFKRFLTQETGNGISNRDVDIWEREIMKKPTWFQNFDATNNALDLLEDTFLQKREEFDAGLDHLYDAGNHRSSDVFNGLVEKYGTLDQVKGLEGKLIFKDGKLIRG